MARMEVRAICVGLLLLAPAGAPSAHAGGQVLTASDVVAIKVVGQPDLDTKARVAPDGTINFPYVGRIKAAGLTEDELALAVERRLIELRILAPP
jgi:protein involved in polysaccharide export with SLBB domain